MDSKEKIKRAAQVLPVSPVFNSVSSFYKKQNEIKYARTEAVSRKEVML